MELFIPQHGCEAFKLAFIVFQLPLRGFTLVVLFFQVKVYCQTFQLVAQLQARRLQGCQVGLLSFIRAGGLLVGRGGAHCQFVNYLQGLHHALGMGAVDSPLLLNHTSFENPPLSPIFSVMRAHMTLRSSNVIRVIVFRMGLVQRSPPGLRSSLFPAGVRTPIENWPPFGYSGSLNGHRWRLLHHFGLAKCIIFDLIDQAALEPLVLFSRLLYNVAGCNQCWNSVFRLGQCDAGLCITANKLEHLCFFPSRLHCLHLFNLVMMFHFFIFALVPLNLRWSTRTGRLTILSKSHSIR